MQRFRPKPKRIVATTGNVIKSFADEQIVISGTMPSKDNVRYQMEHCLVKWLCVL